MRSGHENLVLMFGVAYVAYVAYVACFQVAPDMYLVRVPSSQHRGSSPVRNASSFRRTRRLRPDSASVEVPDS